MGTCSVDQVGLENLSFLRSTGETGSFDSHIMFNLSTFKYCFKFYHVVGLVSAIGTALIIFISCFAPNTTGTTMSGRKPQISCVPYSYLSTP